MKEHRIFCEWNGGAFISSLAPNFQADFVELVESYGPPDKVEFRAHGEGWVGPQPCETCGKDLVDCHCDEQQCSVCKKWFGADPGPHGLCPVCEKNLAKDICPCGCQRDLSSDIFH